MVYNEYAKRGLQMKKMNFIRALFCAMLLGCLSLTTVFADVTQEDINNAKDQVNNLKNQVEEAKDEINKINDKKDKLEGDLKSLNSNLQKLATEMNELEEDITAKQNEITIATAELEAAIARCDKQYEDMKLRIQYMYENGNQSMLELLVESHTVSGFLNQAEYIASINQYDRNKLVEYQNLQEEVEIKKAGLEAEEKELQEMMVALEEKKKKVSTLIAATQTNITQTKQDIADAEDTKKDLEEKLKYWKEYERQLEIQKIQEDLARWDEIQNMEKEDWSGVEYVPQEGEAYLLAAIIQCESDGEPYEGKIAVGSVVMNRVRHSKFPNTITGVIYSPNQFAPVASGRLAYRLEAGVNDTCKRAALEVLSGNITNNCLFFRTVKEGIDGTIIGNHIFY